MKMFMSRALLLGLLLSLCCMAHGSDITDKVFGNIKEGIVAAFGDFNSDELTDIFVICDNMKRLQILYGHETEPLLMLGPFCTYSGKTIVSVVPGDFDGDALMDVLVNIKNDDKESYDVYINWGNTTEIICSKKHLFKSIGEVMALDFNRDMILDLYGLDSYGERTFWIFNSSREQPHVVHQAVPTGSGGNSLSIPNANAYLDLNEDFLADLFLQTHDSYEIWYGVNEHDMQENFSYQYSIKFQPIGGSDYHIGQAVFMDFELRGVQNIVIPFCILANCRNSSIMVHDGNDFRNLHVNFRDPQGITWALVPPVPGDIYLRTITARSGDFNLDGYPDLLLTLQPLNVAKPVMQTFLLENVPCTTCEKSSKRTFEVRWNALSPMGNNTVAGAFYDFYQDGVLDLILIQKNQNGSYRPLAFRNTLDYDANFVKVIVLTGLDNKQNSERRTPLGRKKRTYGTNLPGPRITYSTTTQDGDQQCGSSVQLPQASYFALQLPYTCFGLGRTPNFVDQLAVGLGSKWRNWTQLIPNSQIIVVPKPLNEPSHWKAQLFVTPSKLILMSVVALGGTCLVIILIILVLYIKEKREDKQERLQESHRFHFDAM
ncbi:T-cell immunomodulatory protein [Drosophila guanche]|uniref:Blast:T-cell immunomodulatory protein n=1 Tax=Drosophila guanche TaxID=7266 RepID=A0A3B0K6I6_DROGU|nr:T-cell immunomodulatory protein [Drosophila guanche]SPP89745.1 blast:T-cell immunomodulatory protein [Drosophila guanche]